MWNLLRCPGGVVWTVFWIGQRDSQKVSTWNEGVGRGRTVANTITVSRFVRKDGRQRVGRSPSVSSEGSNNKIYGERTSSWLILNDNG